MESSRGMDSGARLRTHGYSGRNRCDDADFVGSSAACTSRTISSSAELPPPLSACATVMVADPGSVDSRLLRYHCDVVVGAHPPLEAVNQRHRGLRRSFHQPSGRQPITFMLSIYPARPAYGRGSSGPPGILASKNRSGWW